MYYEEADYSLPCQLTNEGLSDYKINKKKYLLFSSYISVLYGCAIFFWCLRIHNPDCISGLGFFSYYLSLLGLQHRLLRLKLMTHI